MRPSQVAVVTRFEFTRTIRRPQFWIAAFLLPSVMAAVILVMAWAGSQRPAAAAPIQFEYSDLSGVVSSKVAGGLGGAPAEEGAAQRARSGELTAYLAFPEDPTTQQVTIIAADRGLMENSAYAQLAQRLFSASVDATLNSDRTVALVRTTVDADIHAYANGKPVDGLGGMIVPGLIALLLLFTVALMGNQMLNSTVEERENRVSEMLLVSLPARALIHGKLIALALVGVVQIGIVIAASTLIYLAAGPGLSLEQFGVDEILFDPVRIGLGLLLLAGGLLSLTALLVLTGAAMPSAKDAAPFFSAVVIITITPVYFITTILLDPASQVVQVLTYFPFTAPMTSLILNATGALDPVVGVVIAGALFAIGTLTLRLAVHMYKRGVIQYDRRLRISDFTSNRA